MSSDWDSFLKHSLVGPRVPIFPIKDICLIFLAMSSKTLWLDPIDNDCERWWGLETSLRLKKPRSLICRWMECRKTRSALAQPGSHWIRRRPQLDSVANSFCPISHLYGGRPSYPRQRNTRILCHRKPLNTKRTSGHLFRFPFLHEDG